MKNLTRFSRAAAAVIVGLLLFASGVQAQTSLNSTTLSAALDKSTTTFAVGSTTNITPASSSYSGDGLFVQTTGELMNVIAVPRSGTVTVRRGVSPTRAWMAVSGATVIITKTGSTIDYDPNGACTTAPVLPFFQMINVITGTVNVCLLSGTWQGRNQIPITQPTTVVLTR